jgi:DNA-binding MarR family transcriptional regulator
MALKGNLRDFSTTQLLNLVNLARKTGKLTINGQNQNAALYFREGRLVYAATNTQEGHLAAMLLKTGKLTSEQAEAINSQASNSSDRVMGKYLMDARLVSRDDIVQGVKDYMLEIVYDLFTWTDGDFFFEQDALPANDRITVPLNLDNVILEGSRRIEQFEKLQDELPDLGIIALKITDKPLRDVKLTQDDWRVISHIHPRNSVKQIAMNNNMDEFQIRKIVYGMLQAGLVETIRPEGLEQQKKLLPLTRAGRKAVSQSPAEKRSVVTKLIDRIRRI